MTDTPRFAHADLPKPALSEAKSVSVSGLSNVPEKKPVDVDAKRRILANPVDIGVLEGKIPHEPKTEIIEVTDEDLELAKKHNLDLSDPDDVIFLRTLKKL